MTSKWPSMTTNAYWYYYYYSLFIVHHSNQFNWHFSRILFSAHLLLKMYSHDKRCLSPAVWKTSNISHARITLLLLVIHIHSSPRLSTPLHQILDTGTCQMYVLLTTRLDWLLWACFCQYCTVQQQAKQHLAWCNSSLEQTQTTYLFEQLFLPSDGFYLKNRSLHVYLTWIDKLDKRTQAVFQNHFHFHFHFPIIIINLFLINSLIDCIHCQCSIFSFLKQTLYATVFVWTNRHWQ